MNITGWNDQPQGDEERQHTLAVRGDVPQPLQAGELARLREQPLVLEAFHRGDRGVERHPGHAARPAIGDLAHPQVIVEIERDGDRHDESQRQRPDPHPCHSPDPFLVEINELERLGEKGHDRLARVYEQ